MFAVISDIHSNTEALAVVLDDIAERGITRVFCLGDVVGYGPEPEQCIDLVKGVVVEALLGNHDCAVLYEPHRFNLGAESACYWTRARLEAEPDKAKRDARWDFLGQLPVKHVWDAAEMGLGEMMLVHGSPRRPVNEYIFPDDIFNSPNKVQGLFDRFEHLCFVGHTHVPGVFLETPDFYSPDELEGVYKIDRDRKALINVGSVGQPRDRDSRAGYVVVTPDHVEFVRLAYAFDVVADKVFAIPELDDYQGTRLREGR